MKYKLTIVIFIFCICFVCFNEGHKDVCAGNSVRIEIKQNFPGDFRLRTLDNELLNIIDYADITIFDANKSSTDFELIINIEGKALGKNYIGAGFNYTGAEIEGLIILKKGEKLLAKEYFHNLEKPWSHLSGTRVKEQDAPFEEVFGKSDFRYKILKIFGDIYGKPFFTNLFTSDKNASRLTTYAMTGGYIIRDIAVDVIGDSNYKFKRDLLLLATKDPCSITRENAIEQLGKMKD